MLYELKIRVWQLDTAVASVDVGLLGMDVVGIAAVVDAANQLAIVPDVVHEDCPLLLAHVAEVLDLIVFFVVFTLDVVDAETSENDVMILVFKHQSDNFFVNDIVVFQSLHNRLLLFTRSESENTVFREALRRSNQCHCHKYLIRNAVIIIIYFDIFCIISTLAIRPIRRIIALTII